MPTWSRTYQRGYTPRISRDSELERKETIRDTGRGSAKSCSYVSTVAKSQPLGSQPSQKQQPSHIPTYSEIKARCLSSGTLWDDPDFKPIASSIFFKKPPSAWPNIQWKRPREFCSNPQLFVDGATRMDVIQGILGDCWLLAAVASLSTNQQQLNMVVPPDQSFQDGYAGIFRFQFWQYGRWVEVLVDDKLPTQNNKLIYMHSEQRNEFWSALLEKAYAKLNGSYEALSGGLTSEALTDFTGGFVERFKLRTKAPANLFNIMYKATKKSALIGCSIDTGEGNMEDQLANGLIIGHAYSVTDVRMINVTTGRMSGQVQMVRVRNPWGDSHEWKGAWSDGSPEWSSVSTAEKQSMGLTFEHDGEFWMSYKDFVNNYERLEICYLGPDSMEEGDLHGGRTKWEATLFEGGWRQRVNAGGCINNRTTFWTNPQYRVDVVDPDSEDDDGNGTILVGLMQKERRKLKKEGKDNLAIGYALYKAPERCTGTLDRRFFETIGRPLAVSEFTDLREVTDHHKIAPGNYVIVPSTFQPNNDGEFILRIFSERKNDKAQELDDVTGETEYIKRPEKHLGGPTAEERTNKEEAKKAFLSLAGADGEIDAYELQDILNKVFSRVFTFDGFSTDMTRSLVSMRDADFTGKLGFEDFKTIWTDLTICRKAFASLDTDRSGYFNSYELRTALNVLSLRVSNATFNAIVMRYSDKEGHIRFDDFVALYIRLKTLFEMFKKKDAGGKGKLKLSLEEFTIMTMYS